MVELNDVVDVVVFDDDDMFRYKSFRITNKSNDYQQKLTTKHNLIL